jgi:hypothetical protein
MTVKARGNNTSVRCSMDTNSALSFKKRCYCAANVRFRAVPLVPTPMASPKRDFQLLTRTEGFPIAHSNRRVSNCSLEQKGFQLLTQTEGFPIAHSNRRVSNCSLEQRDLVWCCFDLAVLEPPLGAAHVARERVCVERGRCNILRQEAERVFRVENWTKVPAPIGWPPVPANKTKTIESRKIQLNAPHERNRFNFCTTFPLLLLLLLLLFGGVAGR